MATGNNKLTKKACDNAHYLGRTTRLVDGGGLYLEVTPAGSKLWRYKFRFQGKEKRLALGAYPLITMDEARKLRDKAKRDLAQGQDPSAQRAVERNLAGNASNRTFEGMARAWIAAISTGWATSHTDKVVLRLEKNVFPWLGARVIGEITSQEVLAVLKRVEDRGARDTTKRLRYYMSKVFRYAISHNEATMDHADLVRDALAPPIRKHFNTITDPDRIGELLRAIDSYSGTLIVRIALALAPLTFVRPGELRGMRWDEIDLDGALWRIPAKRMKLKTATKANPSTPPHLVPLATQSIELLRQLQPLTGRRVHVFPSERNPTRCMSDGTVNAALRRMDFTRDELTGHGFRAMASTLLNEQGKWPKHQIERQLAHVVGNAVEAAYDRSSLLDARREMMQEWADHLDSLKAKKA